MKILFQNSDVDTIPLSDYVRSFIDSEYIGYEQFQLPPIQRNSVWNVAQIERLWDSMLRGYPIGSFLFSKRNPDDSARDLLSGTQKKSSGEGFFLLDGQQRTRSIVLGYKPNENARLWIDLNPNLSFGPEYNDRKFLFRVITGYQPWGMSDRNPVDKIDERQKYHARQELKKENLHYDYQVNISNESNANYTSFSWPVKSELPIPFDLLINLCGGTSGKFKQPAWADVCKIIPERYHALGKIPDKETNSFKEIVSALIPLIELNSSTKRTRNIVLLYQNTGTQIKSPEIQDDMEVLFRRVNSGGTVLQGEEMAYSLLKSSWDGAYEMVWTITKNPSIGYLLSPTAIVMAASRLARIIQNQTDSANPSIGNFRKWLGEKGDSDNKSFLDTMQSLLIFNENKKAVFHNVIESFCELVIYRDKIPDDIGLPKKLLLSIKPLIYHPVLFWIYKNNCNKEVLEANRKNVLRYLLYCFLTGDKPDQISRNAISTIKGNATTDFPDFKIYEALIDEELSVLLPTPEEFKKPFNSPVTGFFRHRDHLFNIPEDSFNTFRNWFWNDSKEFLLWVQRRFAAKWFVGYDPTSDDTYDTPYDWDHIMPRSHIITSGASAITHSEDEDGNNSFHWNKDLYVNSIGNFRLWPFWGNRSDSNQCHTQKLRMVNPDWDNDTVARKFDCYSVQDFLEASAINVEDENLWLNAGGSVRDWTEERRIAWQTAVERRVVYLFEQLYSTFEFNEWNKKETEV